MAQRMAEDSRYKSSLLATLAQPANADGTPVGAPTLPTAGTVAAGNADEPYALKKGPTWREKRATRAAAAADAGGQRTGMFDDIASDPAPFERRAHKPSVVDGGGLFGAADLGGEAKKDEVRGGLFDGSDDEKDY